MARIKYYNAETKQWEYADGMGTGGSAKYELIETITMETAATLTRTAEPDGTPYNFEAMFFHVLIPAGAEVTNGSFLFYNSTGANFIHRWTAAITAGTEPVSFAGRVYRSNGIWCWYLPNEFKANGSSPLLYDTTKTNIGDIVNDDMIKKIVFTHTFPAGAVINIYGVRS